MLPGSVPVRTIVSVARDRAAGRNEVGVVEIVDARLQHVRGSSTIEPELVVAAWCKRGHRRIIRDLDNLVLVHVPAIHSRRNGGRIFASERDGLRQMVG